MANSIFKIRNVKTFRNTSLRFFSFFLRPLTWPPGGVALPAFYRPVRWPVGVEKTYNVCISLGYPHVQPSDNNDRDTELQ